MKKYFAVFTALLLLAALAGCQQVAPVSGFPASSDAPASAAPEPGASQPAPVSTDAPPQPTPEPAKTIAVISDVPEKIDVFVQGLSAGLDAAEYSVVPISGKLESAASEALQVHGTTAVVAWIAGDAYDAASVDKALQNVKDAGIPLLVANRADMALSVDAPVYTFSAAGNGCETFLDAAIAFPPHDTPVRLTGIFANESSPLRQAYAQYEDAGKILPKGEFYLSTLPAGDVSALQTWLAEHLEAYPEGALDAFVVEDGAAALAVSQALAQSGRKDKAEVFALDFGSDLLTEMRAHPNILAMCYGPNDYRMGSLCAADIPAALSGSAPSGQSLPLSLVYASALGDDLIGLLEDAPEAQPSPMPMPIDAPAQ